MRSVEQIGWVCRCLCVLQVNGTQELASHFRFNAVKAAEYDPVFVIFVVAHRGSVRRWEIKMNHGRNPMNDVAAGVIAGLAASFAMDVFSLLVRAGNDGREAAGAAPGSDRSGRGAQPPQAEGNAANDAAVRSGSAVYEAVTGHPPSRDLKPWLGSAAHYLFGAGAGAIYGVLAPRSESIRSGFGTVYGSMVWAIADEGIIPALGLSRGPRQLPAGVQLYSLAGHWVYGATLESVRRAIAVRR